MNLDNQLSVQIKDEITVLREELAGSDKGSARLAGKSSGLEEAAVLQKAR